tara:strand:- start:21 stop:287 length:267 start_codon:yes stop_codon:yes gene_type:complete
MVFDITGMFGKMIGGMKGGYGHGGVFGLQFSPIFILILGVFWIWMLIDCLKRNFKKDNEKLIWVLVLIFTHIIGAAIYFFLIKSKNKN